jgi:hypothetical protein
MAAAAIEGKPTLTFLKHNRIDNLWSGIIL